MIEKVQAQIIAEVDDPSLKKAGQKMKLFARDTGKELDKSTYIKMQIDIANAQKQLQKVRQELKQAQKQGNKDLEMQLTIKTNLLQSKLTEAKRQFNNYVNNGEQGLSRLQKKFDGVTDSMGGSKFGGILQTLNKVKLAWIAIAGAIGGAIGKIGQFLGDSAKVYESQQLAFVRVQKTLDATSDEYAKIESNLRKMSVNLSTDFEELARIAEVGGQMGISASGITKFTETVAKLGMAISGVDASEAATQLARLIGILGEDIQNIDRVGSALVGLGNNFKATEGEILDFAERLAGAGAMADMTSADILGIATAFTDLGVKAEVGGTALQTAIITMNEAVNEGGDALQRFAEVSGMGADEFKRLWKEDAAAGLVKFVQGLGEAGDETSLIIKELFGNNSRMIRAFGAAAESADVLADAVKMANEEYAENVAMTREVNKFLESNQKQLEKNENRWKNWKYTLGELISELKLIFGDVFTKYIPAAFMMVEIIARSLLVGLKKVFTGIAYAIHQLGNVFVWLDALVEDIIESIKYNFNVLKTNMELVFSSVPNAVRGMANSVIAYIEGLINKTIGMLKSLAEQVNRLPGVNIDTSGLTDVNLGRVGDGKTFGEVLDAMGGKKLEFMTKNIDKASKNFGNATDALENRLIQIEKDADAGYKRAIERMTKGALDDNVYEDIVEGEKEKAKTSREIIDEIADELEDLYGDKGGGGGGGGGKSGKAVKKLTEAEKKAEEIRQKALEDIQKVNDNAMLLEEEKWYDIQKIREKADEEIKKLNMDEYEMELYLAEKASDNAKKLTEEQIKEQKKLLKDKARAEIDAINESTKSEKQKVEEITKIYEDLDEKLADLEKDDDERQRDSLKKRQDAIEDVKDIMQEYYDALKDEAEDVQKKIEDINKDIKKTVENIEKIQDNIDKLGEDTSDKLASREEKIIEKLNEMKQKYDGIERMMYIGEDTLKRNLESQFGNDLTGKTILEYKQLYDELELIKKNADLITEKSREKATENETQRILREREEKLAQYEEEMALEQQKLEELQAQKEEQEAIYQAIDDYRRELEEGYSEFLKKEIDDRIARLEELRQQALRTAAAVGAATGSTYNVSSNIGSVNFNSTGTIEGDTDVFLNTVTDNIQLAKKGIYK